MNKTDLINKIAEEAGITKAQAAASLNAVIDGVKETLKAGDKVAILGFGTFSLTERAARDGRNPKTGDLIKIAARRSVRFKPGKDLGDYVA